MAAEYTRRPWKHRSSDEQLSERAKIAHWLAQGKEQWEIQGLLQADGIERSRATISRDVAAIRQRWWRNLHRKLDQWIIDQLAQYRAIKAEAWTAWHASKGIVERTTRTLHQRGGAESTTVTVSEVTGYGDVQYLHLIKECMEAEARLLGLNAPIEVETYVRWEAERIAKEFGLKTEEVLAEAESILRGTDGLIAGAA
jgi:hypothetical protein